jgi:hypothetical protein
MSDLSITAASVIAGSDSVYEYGLWGETGTAGMPVYKDTSTNKWMKADNNSATAAARRALGIALNGGGNNQPVKVHKQGDITIGATLTAGARYYLSETAGGIQPEADLATTGEYVCLLGVAKSTTVLALNIQYPDVALP